jgi:hypothetical protein
VSTCHWCEIHPLRNIGGLKKKTSDETTDHLRHGFIMSCLRVRRCTANVDEFGSDGQDHIRTLGERFEYTVVIFSEGLRRTDLETDRFVWSDLAESRCQCGQMHGVQPKTLAHPAETDLRVC